MSNILIITAHPSKHNLTRGITDIYKSEKEKQGDSVEVLDLYQSQQLPFLDYIDMKSYTPTKEALLYQEQILKADELVFVHPFWWGTIPGILKNWIDSVFTMGFAAKYGKDGRPIGLLTGRSVKIISTSGAPTFCTVSTALDMQIRRYGNKPLLNFVT